MVAVIRVFTTLARSLALAAAFALASTSWADKIQLKDGTTVEGVVVRETDTFIQIKVKLGGLESIKTLLRADIKNIEKDAPTPTPTPTPVPAPVPASTTTPAPASGPAPVPASEPARPATPPPSNKALERARVIDSSTSRVAILNFGPPSSWGGDVGSTIGIQVNSFCWRQVVPLLEKDQVNVVVVRINSGGGHLSELEPFHRLFHNVYKKKFRTVAWVESGISAAAMAPWPLEEVYFMPNGSYGACTGFSGNFQNVEGAELEGYLLIMERASAMANRPSCIMRSMQVQEPLSATIDEKTGEVTWFQDTTGQFLLNRPGQIYTMTANDAVKFKFAKAIAATRDELVKAMGIHEVVWAGDEAIRFVDDHMRAANKTEKEWNTQYRGYQLYLSYAEQAQDRADRGKFVGKAIAALRQMRMFSVNPNYGEGYGINAEWFEVREAALRKLLQDR